MDMCLLGKMKQLAKFNTRHWLNAVTKTEVTVGCRDGGYYDDGPLAAHGGDAIW